MAPMGRYVALAIFACLFGVSNPQELVLQRGNTQSVTQVQLDSRGRYLATGAGPGFDFLNAENGGVRLWDLRTGLLDRNLEASIGTVKRLVFSPDGSLLLATSDTFCTCWNVDTGMLLGTIDGPSADIDPRTGEILALVRIRSSDRKTLLGWELQSLASTLKPVSRVSMPMVSIDTMRETPPNIMCFSGEPDIALVWPGRVEVIDRKSAQVKSTAKISGSDILFTNMVRVGNHGLAFSSLDFGSVFSFSLDRPDQIVRSVWKGRTGLVGPFALIAGPHPRIGFRTNEGFQKPSEFRAWDSSADTEASLADAHPEGSDTSGPMTLSRNGRIAYVGNLPYDVPTGLSLANAFQAGAFPAKALWQGKEILFGSSPHSFTSAAFLSWSPWSGLAEPLDPFGNYSFDVAQNGTRVSRDSQEPVVSIVSPNGSKAQFSAEPKVFPVGFSNGGGVFAGEVGYVCKPGSSLLVSPHRAALANDIAWRANESLIVAFSTADDLFRVYSASSGLKLWQAPYPRSGGIGPADSLVFDCWPAGKNEVAAVVTHGLPDGSLDSSVVWYDVRTKAELARVHSGHGQSIAFPDGSNRFVCIVSRAANSWQPDDKLTVIDLAKRKIVTDVAFPFSNVTSIGSDGSTVLIGTKTGEIWSSQSGQKAIKLPFRFGEEVRAVYPLSGGKLLAGLTDKFAVTTQSNRQPTLHKLSLGWFGDFNAIKKDPASGLVDVLTDNVLAKIGADGRLLSADPVPEFGKDSFLRIAPDGKSMMTVSKDSLVSWDTETRTPKGFARCDPMNYVTATYGSGSTFFVASDVSNHLTEF